MKKYHPQLALTSRMTGLIIVAFILLTAAAAPALAQKPTSSPRSSSNASHRRAQDIINQADMRNREWTLANNRKAVRNGVTRGPQQSLLPQVKEDFERIQAINNEMLLASAPNNSLDYKRLGEINSELKKRASRLKANLAFPEIIEQDRHAKDQEAPDNPQIKENFSLLDRSITSFVNNPLFQSKLDVIDVTLANKASRDLESILKLSDNIKKIIGKQKKQ